MVYNNSQRGINLKNKITISVIIPVYNREQTILRCLESVINQTYQPNEIIVVDDGSTDRSIEYVKNIHNKIKIIRNKKNGGAQVARNIGIKTAKCEWISFLDSDDEWLPNKLEKQVSALETVDFELLTVVHGDCYVINNEIKKLWNLHKVDGPNVYRNLLSKSGMFFPAMLTSKQALEKINYLDESVPSYQEWDTAIRLSIFCEFIHIQEPLFNYYVHEDTMSTNTKTNIDGYQYIINKFKNEIIDNCGIETLQNHIINQSILAMNYGQFDVGRRLTMDLPNNRLKKYQLLFYSYLRIKPISLTRIIKKFYGKRS